MEDNGVQSNNKEKSGVLVIGSANMDMVVKTSHFPSPGETILGESFQMFSGGKGANQAVASARLGTKTIFIGRFGTDIFKDRLFESMNKDKVDLSGCFIDQTTPTGIALITVDSKGENQIVVVSGSNMLLTPVDIEQSLEYFKSSRVVLTQLEIPVETVLKTAELSKDNGCTFILNPAPAVKQLPERLFSLTDVITPNEGELEIMTGIAVSSIDDVKKASLLLIEKGVKKVICTMGEKGSALVTKESLILVKARKVSAVDTTGAGDAFNGALAKALSDGYKDQKAVEFASIAASVSVTRMGAQSSMPSMEEVLGLIKESEKKTYSKR